MIAGAILAGGEGRRIGGAKAMTALSGAPLIAHAARAMEGCGALAVVGDAAAAEAIGATYLCDPPGLARGPLAGVLAGLHWAHDTGADWLATAPCDAPLLPDGLIQQLRLAAGESALACVQSESGLEPLIALWRPDLEDKLRAALSGGAHPPVNKLMHEWGAAFLTLQTEEVMNVNTPEDLARAETLLASRA